MGKLLLGFFVGILATILLGWSIMGSRAIIPNGNIKNAWKNQEDRVVFIVGHDPMCVNLKEAFSIGGPDKGTDWYIITYQDEERYLSARKGVLDIVGHSGIASTEAPEKLPYTIRLGHK